jgi:hypothetical protein
MWNNLRQVGVKFLGEQYRYNAPAFRAPTHQIHGVAGMYNK